MTPQRWVIFGIYAGFLGGYVAAKYDALPRLAALINQRRENVVRANANAAMDEWQKRYDLAQAPAPVIPGVPVGT